MTRRLVFRPQAEDEVLEVQRWYEQRREGLGNEFETEVETLVSRIIMNPFAFPLVHRETRRGVLNRFPYAIYFRLTQEEIVILAIHGRQDPSRWKTRS